MTRAKTISLDEIKNLFYYDESSPTFLRWRTDRRAGKDYNILVHKEGDVAGFIREPSGYYFVSYNGRHVRAHRVVYSLCNGIEIPTDMVIDHINGVRTDNSINNLRLVSISENQKNRIKLQENNKSSVNGVNWEDSGNRWRVHWVDIDGKKRSKTFTPTVLYPNKSFEDAIALALIDAKNFRRVVEKENGYISKLNEGIQNED